MVNTCKNIFAIFKKEMLSFFVSPVAYIVITGFILMSGYFFINFLAYYDLVLQQYAAMGRMTDEGIPGMNEFVVARFYYTLMVILVFLIPVLTMRLIAEERRTGTFEMLAISPLSITEIVLGKFLGVAAVLGLMLFSVFLFPLFLYMQAEFEFWPMLLGLLGLYLYALGFASIGMAISAFTNNQVVAAVGSMVTLLLLYMINSPAESVGGTVGEVLKYLSPAEQAVDLLLGVIETKSLIYFASLILVGIFFSQRALEAQRWR